MSNFFDSFENFQQEFDQPNSHWAIDVYSPPEAGYVQAMNWACQLQTRGYQLGALSIAARAAFGKTFGGDRENDVATYFCPTGTAANVMARFTVLDQNKSMIVYSPISHSVDREAGSVESLTGSRLLKASDLLSLKELNAYKEQSIKYIRPDDIKKGLESREHYYLNQKPHMISISLPGEDGSIAPLDYVREMADFASSNDMLLHLDGARLFVAAGAAGKTLKEMSTDLGADIVTLGGSKVGMIGAESVVFTPNFFDKYPRLHHYKDAKSTFDLMRSNQKRFGALSGRSEEVSAQYLRALTDDYGIQVGRRAHLNTVKLAGEIESVPGVRLESPVETNVALVRMTSSAADLVRKEYPYHKDFPVDETGQSILRFMGSHATKDEHIDQAIQCLKRVGTICPL